MAIHGRAGGGEHAERVNAAAELADGGVPAAEAARVLAARFGCSPRQARRYVDQATASGRVRVPEATVVFTVKVPARLAAAVREHARLSGRTISAVVAQALEEFLDPGPQKPSSQVSVRPVEAEFVFGRHAATELSVAYAILVPQRRARIVRAGQEGRPPHDERGDLRPGVQCPAEEGRDDRVADRGAARARRAQRA